MLDPRREEAISRVRRDVTSAFADRLLCLVLYGSGIGDDYVAGRSDLNIAVVLDRVGIPDLKRLRSWLPSWQKLGVGVPLFIDRAFLDRARDVFPIELEDIRAAHLLLAGEDLFSGLQIAPADLRRELEQEVRAKLLRLRTAYAESSGNAEEIRELMAQSVKSFAVIIRACQRVHGEAPPLRLLDVLARFEEAHACQLPAMRLAAEVKLGIATWSGDAETRFAAYLAEVEALVAVVDRL